MREPIAIAPQWRLLRAFVFALLAVGIGVIGHAVSAGCAPEPLVLLLGIPAVTGYGYLFTAERLSCGMLTASVVAIQACAHVVCEVLGTPMPSGAAMQSMPGMQHDHMAHQVSSAASGSSPWMMLAVHVVATIAALVVLLRLERTAWTTLRRVGRLLSRRSSRSGGAVRITGREPLIPVRVSSDASARSAWFVAQVGRRGPPRAAAPVCV